MDASLISKLKSQLEDTDLIFRWYKYLYKICGCWPTEEKGFLVSLRRSPIYLNLLFMLFLPIALFTPELEGIDEFGETISLFLLSAVIVLYTLVLHFKKNDIKNSIENLMEIRLPDKSTSDSEMSIHRKFQQWATFNFVLMHSGIMVVVFLVVIMLVAMQLQRRFPMKIWIPFEDVVYANIEILILFLTPLLLLNTYLMPWSMALQMFIYIFLIGEFKVLQEKFKCIRDTAFEKLSIDQTVELVPIFTTTGENVEQVSQISDQDHDKAGISGPDQRQPKSSTSTVKSHPKLSISGSTDFHPKKKTFEDVTISDVDSSEKDPGSQYAIQHCKDKNQERLLDVKTIQLLKQYIQKHQILLEYLSQNDQLLGVMLLIDTLFCLFMTVLVTFISTKIDERDPIYFVTLLITTGLLQLLYLKCYLVDRLSSETSKVRDAAYACGWQDASKEFKQNLRIVITRANVPFVLSGLGFVNFSVQTFEAVIRTAYSYYTVISNLVV